LEKFNAILQERSLVDLGLDRVDFVLHRDRGDRNRVQSAKFGGFDKCDRINYCHVGFFFWQLP
jgi:hypothetical protein